jgi:hypothetical protein
MRTVETVEHGLSIELTPAVLQGSLCSHFTLTVVHMPAP